MPHSNPFSVTIRHTAHASSLKAFRRAFEPIAPRHVPTGPETAWEREGKLSHDLQVLFFGKTGYGKSTTINRLIGLEVLSTSDVAPCTRSCQCVDFTLASGKHLSFGDLPGIGDTRDLDEAYKEAYRDFLAKAAGVVYILRADQRDYREDLLLLRDLGLDQRSPLIIGLNQIDKIEPRRTGRTSLLSREQAANVRAKVESVAECFEVPAERIVPYSAKLGRGLDELARAIVGLVT